MESLGNARAREVYGEAGSKRVSKRVDDDVLEAHVRDKYAKVKAAPGDLPAASGKLFRCEEGRRAELPGSSDADPSLSTPEPVEGVAAEEHVTTVRRNLLQTRAEPAHPCTATSPPTTGNTCGRGAVARPRQKVGNDWEEEEKGIHLEEKGGPCGVHQVTLAVSEAGVRRAGAKRPSHRGQPLIAASRAGAEAWRAGPPAVAAGPGSPWEPWARAWPGAVRT